MGLSLNNLTEGVAAHTDEGAVTFNFWITPNDANLSPDRGGLIVYAKEQPLDWDWSHYNNKKYCLLYTSPSPRD